MYLLRKYTSVQLFQCGLIFAINVILYLYNEYVTFRSIYWFGSIRIRLLWWMRPIWPFSYVMDTLSIACFRMLLLLDFECSVESCIHFHLPCLFLLVFCAVFAKFNQALINISIYYIHKHLTIETTALTLFLLQIFWWLHSFTHTCSLNKILMRMRRQAIDLFFYFYISAFPVLIVYIFLSKRLRNDGFLQFQLYCTLLVNPMHKRWCKWVNV